jgi:hypothetical protein
MKLVLAPSRLGASARSGVRVAVVAVVAVLALSCNEKAPQQPPPSHDAAKPKAEAVDILRLPTKKVLANGIKYTLPPDSSFSRGVVVVEGDFPAGDDELKFRVLIKRSGMADVPKDREITGGKNTLFIPLDATDLGPVTEISWKERELLPDNWRYKWHYDFGGKSLPDGLFFASASVTHLGEVHCCKAPDERGMFTTPIGVTIILQH